MAYKSARKSLELQQLSNKIKGFAAIPFAAVPPAGWIKAARTALGMTLQQIGKKAGMTRQSVLALEKREREGTISLRALQEAAAAMDMHLVYGFVPNAGSLEALIEQRALELATHVVMRTHQTMLLENQSNSEDRIQAAIAERAAAFRVEMPKILWD
jgi:predicted DNA-binding mobile mystery protein A